MNHQKAIQAALAGILALGITTSASSAPVTPKPGQEKCYGVAKAGKNDCAGGAHACAGQGTKEKSAKEFIKLPKGTCERIVGGSLTPGK